METGNMLNLTAILEPADEGGYVCWFEEMPEAMSQGENLEEAINNLKDAFKLLIEYKREQAENSLQGKNIIRKTIPLTAF